MYGVHIGEGRLLNENRHVTCGVLVQLFTAFETRQRQAISVVKIRRTWKELHRKANRNQKNFYLIRSIQNNNLLFLQ